MHHCGVERLQAVDYKVVFQFCTFPLVINRIYSRLNVFNEVMTTCPKAVEEQSRIPRPEIRKTIAASDEMFFLRWAKTH